VEACRSGENFLITGVNRQRYNEVNVTQVLTSTDALLLSVVASCYEEEESLDEFYRRVSTVCRETVSDSYEIVLVNDGSQDGTWAQMVRLAEADSHLVAVNLSRNHGHQLALSAGLHICRGRRILIIDSDLQDPPELLPKMMSLMDTGVDVVYGRRISRQDETLFKKTSAACFYRLLTRFADVQIPVDTGDFRLLSRRALDVLNRMPEHYRFIRGLVSWIGFRQEALPYERCARFAGQTKYPLSKMILFAFDAITSFSVRPLRLASYLGFAFALAALAMLLYVFGAWLTGHVVQGWTSLAAIILLLGSCQLLVLGLMGEYLGRLYIESKDRPLFVIQDILRSPHASAPAEPNGGVTLLRAKSAKELKSES
jgi:polyisoprenyl-phosphate glycosyltransferase